MRYVWLILGITASVLTQVVRADGFSWSLSSGTGSFQTPTNWSPAGVPGVSDSVTFGAAATFGVSFAANVQNGGATVGSSGGTDVTFGLGGYTWLLDTLSFAGSAVARFGGGTLTVKGTPSVDPNQRLVLESGSCSFAGLNTSSLGGWIDVFGGEHSVSNGMSLSPIASGAVVFRMTNGVFFLEANNNSRFVMNDVGAKGPVVAIEGGTFKLGNLDIYNGELNINTNGTYLTAPASIGRGSRRIGILNIYGGTVSNYAGNTLSVGMGTAGLATTGMIHLADGVLYNSLGANLGGSTDVRTTNSVGIIKVDGGRVVLGGTLAMGGNTWTRGLYTQSGGTSWCDNVRMGIYGTGARGEIFLSGGSLALNSAPNLGYASSCTGLICQTGGDLVISNSVNVGAAAGATGLFECSGGNTEIRGDIRLGNAAGAYGLFEYDGTHAEIQGSVRLGNAAGAYGKAIYNGSSLKLNDWVIGAASSATGELEVAGGTLVRPVHLNVAASAGSVGLLRVTGGDLVVSNSLSVGRADGGYGELTLESGSIRVLGSSIGVVIGSGIGATGVMHIAGGSFVATNWYALFAADNSGAYGEIVISGGTNDFASGRIGHNTGTGLLRVEGGNTYFTNAINPRLTIANMTGSTGRLEVVGGVLSVLSVGTWSSSTTDITRAEILFDGGTLQRGAPGDTAVFVDTGFDLATLTDRGAVIDSNGSALGIRQALADEPGTAGRFTKKGAGTVTLSSTENTFTGPVCVEKGELAVSGAIYLTGGLEIDTGAVLNLSSGVVRDATTAAGTTSRVDGALCLASGMALTNGTGAAFSGSGVVTGDVVFATGSVWALDKNAYAGPLKVTGTATFASGTMIRLTGYTPEELASGITLVQGDDAGKVEISGVMPVTLDGASHPYWRVILSPDGRTLTARVIPLGTLISVF